MTPIPTTPAEWAAIVPNDTDRAIAESWAHASQMRGVPCADLAASRIAEHERCVERLARELALPYRDEPIASDFAEARRILEDR